MAEYEKLVLESLPKSAVVNSRSFNQHEEVDEIIINAVSEHITKIVTPEQSEEQEIKTVEASNLNTQEQPLKSSPSEEEIEQIKQEAYILGAEEAVAKYEKLIEQLKSEKNFVDLLKEKLSAIEIVTDLDSQISKVSAESIATIAKKLHLILPVNFEEILSQGLLEKLKKFYKEGKVILTIHPSRYDFCTESLRSDSIPDKLKENFQIIKDETIGIDDCKLEWSSTCLEYNQAQLTSEIDKIIEQLGAVK